MRKEKLEILLTEYNALKSEESNLFIAQFTVIGIWLAFLGILINSILEQIECIEKYAYEGIDVFVNVESMEVVNAILTNSAIFGESRTVITLLIWILLPGVNALFFLIWLDLTTRFIKQAHYIYTIECRILKHYPGTMNFEHFLYEETSAMPLLKKTNYMYYCLMLGVMIISFILMGIFAINFRHLCQVKWYHILFSIFVVGFTGVCTVLYVLRILSYANQKDEQNDRANNKLKRVLESVFVEKKRRLYHVSRNNREKEFIDTRVNVKNDIVYTGSLINKVDCFFEFSKEYESKEIQKLSCEKGWYKEKIAAEAIFESVRRRKFPEKPSRLTSMYFTNSFKHAVAFNNKARKGEGAIFFSDAEVSKIFCFNMDLFDDVYTRFRNNGLNEDTFSYALSVAEIYWSGYQDVYSKNCEILYHGKTVLYRCGERD